MSLFLKGHQGNQKNPLREPKKGKLCTKSNSLLYLILGSDNMAKLLMSFLHDRFAFRFRAAASTFQASGRVGSRRPYPTCVFQNPPDLIRSVRFQTPDDPTRPDPTRPDPTRPDPRDFESFLTQPGGLTGGHFLEEKNSREEPLRDRLCCTCKW